jgi:hypothetical protein
VIPNIRSRFHYDNTHVVSKIWLIRQRQTLIGGTLEPLTSGVPSDQCKLQIVA